MGLLKLDKIEYTDNISQLEKNIVIYAERIRDWELEAGESFNDYFMHDYTDYENWGHFLIDHGLVQRGELILKWYIKDEINKQDQNTLFNMYSGTLKYSAEYDTFYFDDDEFEGDWEELYHKDMLLFAEYILSDEDRKEDFDIWYKNHTGE